MANCSSCICEQIKRHFVFKDSKVNLGLKPLCRLYPHGCIFKTVFKFILSDLNACSYLGVGAANIKSREEFQAAKGAVGF